MVPKGNPIICNSLSQGGGISQRKREMVDVVGGSMAERLVEDRAGTGREGTMSPAYRSHLDGRSSADLALVSLSTTGR